MAAAGRNWAMASGRCSAPCCPALPKYRSSLSRTSRCLTCAFVRTSCGPPLLESSRRGVRPGEPWRCVAAGRQVSSVGDVELVCGVWFKGKSKMALSGGRGLGPEGATRLAGLLREAPPLLASLILRQ